MKRLAMIVLVVCLAACGGGGGGPDTATPTTTEAPASTTTADATFDGSTFDVTAAEYIDQFNTLQIGILQLTDDGPIVGLETKERDWADATPTSRLYGGVVEPGVRVLIVAGGLDEPVQVAMVSVDVTGGSLSTPAKLIAAVGSNLFDANSGDSTRLAAAFATKAVPELGSVSNYPTPIDLAGLATFEFRVAQASVVFTFYAPHGKAPSLLNLPTTFER